VNWAKKVVPTLAEEPAVAKLPRFEVRLIQPDKFGPALVRPSTAYKTPAFVNLGEVVLREEELLQRKATVLEALGRSNLSKVKLEQNTACSDHYVDPISTYWFFQTHFRMIIHLTTSSRWIGWEAIAFPETS
jgi:hypothetical protein